MKRFFSLAVLFLVPVSMRAQSARTYTLGGGWAKLADGGAPSAAFRAGTRVRRGHWSVGPEISYSRFGGYVWDIPPEAPSWMREWLAPDPAASVVEVGLGLGVGPRLLQLTGGLGVARAWETSLISLKGQFGLGLSAGLRVALPARMPRVSLEIRKHRFARPKIGGGSGCFLGPCIGEISLDGYSYTTIVASIILPGR